MVLNDQDLDTAGDRFAADFGIRVLLRRYFLPSQATPTVDLSSGAVVTIVVNCKANVYSKRLLRSRDAQSVPLYGMNARDATDQKRRKRPTMVHSLGDNLHSIFRVENTGLLRDFHGGGA
jgi:hypothetical protein